MQLFSNDAEGVFLRRPNRFVVEVDTGKALVRAHCPNPGRLREILIPGRRVVLEARRDPTPGSTTHTLAAAYYRNRIVPLLPSRANRVAQELLLSRLFRGITAIRPEAALDEGRTDFLVSHGGGETLVEVKSCSLVEYGVAMFPDAKSERASRHLASLAAASKDGVVLFVVTHGRPELFCPNVHSDPDFAEALGRFADRVSYRAFVIEAASDGSITLRGEIPVLTSLGRLVAADCGTLATAGRNREATVSGAFYCPGLRKAVRQAAAPPALRRFPIYGRKNLSPLLEGQLAEDPAFIDEVLRLRHRGPLEL